LSTGGADAKPVDLSKDKGKFNNYSKN